MTTEEFMIDRCRTLIQLLQEPQSRSRDVCIQVWIEYLVVAYAYRL
jgi:hypothetical protein